MRLIAQTAVAAALLAFLASPAPSPALAQTPPVAAKSGDAANAAAPAERVRPRRQPLAERFADANTTHDGHLTRGQADAAKWPYVTMNFDAIDKDHKGFVSVDDIRGYAAAKRAERRAAAPTASKG